MGKFIDVPVGNISSKSYLSLPASNSGPGVLLLPAWWGLNDFFKTLCDRLANEGFVALAPDYYGGKVAATVEEAAGLEGSLDHQAVIETSKAIVSFLLAHPSVNRPRLGVIGFSLGAYLACSLAPTLPDEIAALVTFYGIGEGKFEDMRAAVLSHGAERDEWDAAPKDMAAFEAKLKAAGLETHFYTYPDTDHWFFEENVPEAYRRDAAQLAWERTLTFLREKLE